MFDGICEAFGMMLSPGRSHKINHPGRGTGGSHGVDHRQVKRKSLFPAMLAHKKRSRVKPPAEFLVKPDETALADKQRKIDHLLVEEFDSPANAARRESLLPPPRLGLHPPHTPNPPR